LSVAGSAALAETGRVAVAVDVNAAGNPEIVVHRGRLEEEGHRLEPVCSSWRDWPATTGSTLDCGSPGPDAGAIRKKKSPRLGRRGFKRESGDRPLSQL